MEKLRKSLQPVCDEFIQTYTPSKKTNNNFQELTYEKLKYVNEITCVFLFISI